MRTRKTLNIVILFIMSISLMFGGGAPVAAHSTGAQNVNQPYRTSIPAWVPNDELGQNGEMSQMRTTTQAMRLAAALNLAQNHKAVTKNFAGLDPATVKYSPLANVAQAGNKSPDQVATMAAPLSPPDYFGVPNWTNSPLPELDNNGAVVAGTGIRKFVDTLPGLCGISPWGNNGANGLGQCIPVAVPDTTTFPGSDYYQIALVDYREQMHPDLPATGTEIRGYVQVVPSSYPGAVPLTQANGLVKDILDAQGNPVYGATKPHYMGPLIIAKGCELGSPNCNPVPVRVKFTNYVATGPEGDLFIPVDTTYMGAGMGPGGSLKAITVNTGGGGYTSAPTVVFNDAGTGGSGAVATATVIGGKVVSIEVTNGGTNYATPPAVSFTGGGGSGATASAVLAGLPGEMYTQNRATLHLHGGNTPWISDGTPHQWTTPQGELTSYSRGASVSFVPDMWFDANGNLITGCAGQTSCNVAGATNDPGLGSLTFYWTNQESGRLLFYHDHAYGITRLNVYAGEAAGYLITDPAEEDALAAARFPGTVGSTPASTDLNHLIPLIIQDKTYVPDDGQPGGLLAATDPTWDVNKYGGKGNMWLPHVWMPNQNPADVTGANDFGRWDYGPWFWPPQDPSTFVPSGQPYPCDSAAYPPGSPPAFPPLMCPGIPNPSGVMEGMMDTPIINGAAYPTLTVDPTAYRFQVLSVGNDRTFDLSLYVAELLSVAVTKGGGGYTAAPTVSFSGGGGSGAVAVAKMSNGSVTSILITNVGKGYTNPPNVIITGDGRDAAAKAVIDPITGTLLAINITNMGSGYTFATVSIDPPLGCTANCVTATAIANITPPGTVLGVEVTNPGSGWTSAPTVTFTNAPGDTTGAGAAGIASINSEVKMVDAVPHSASSSVPACSTPTEVGGSNLAMAALDANGNPLNGTGLPAGCWPSTWPTDGRDGGVPDPLTAGPPIIQVGTESGLLPSPVVIPSTPVGYEYNRKSITVLNVFTHGLLLGPAERADIVVDFSQFAGKTLIMYNDAPAPVPAFDPRNDYYTGDPDQTVTGGAPSTLPGYGPNTRTLMQIKVNAVSAGSSGALSSIAVTSSGSGYKAPTVSISGGNGTGATATAMGSVTGLTLTNAGTGYTNPVVSFSGGGGSGASASFTSGAVGSLTLTANGAGYTSAPSVAITGGGGSLATATASGSVDAVSLVSGGGGYASMAVTLSGGGGTGATASASGAVDAASVTSGGAGYRIAPSVTFTNVAGDTTGSGAVATSSGAVDAVAVTNGGSGYLNMPTVSFTNAVTDTTGAGAAATASGAVDTIAVTTAGAGYVQPAVNLAGGATAVATGGVDSLTLTNGGGGYLVPVVSFSGGNGAGASATATGSVDAIQVTLGGTGYISPVVTITDGIGIGTGATAKATTNITGTITAITVLTGGNNYTAPQVAISDALGPGSGASATATMALTGLSLGSAGSGYNAAPAVSITDGTGTGSGATAAATIAVTGVTVTSGGAGYASAPAVSITDNAGTPTTLALASAFLKVSAVSVTNGGAGYTYAPSVVFSGGSATAQASLMVTAINLASGGAGYTLAPTVVFTNAPGDLTGSGAAATTTLQATNLTLGLGGSGYTSAPAINFTGGGTGASGSTTLMVTGLILTSPGSGYLSAPTVSFSGGGGSGAAATATVVATGLALTNSGSGYTTAPTVTITDNGGTGSGATAEATLSINSIALTNAGSGYTSLPTVTIVDTNGGTGSGASAVAQFSNTMLDLNALQTVVPQLFTTQQNRPNVTEPAFPVGNGGSSQAHYVRIQDTSLSGWIGSPVPSLTLTSGGAGYTSAPTVSIAGGGGSGATATASFYGAFVNGLSLTNRGAGYTTVPTVTFDNTGTGGSGVAATASLDQVVYTIQVTNGGNGYTSAPTVTINPRNNRGSGATAVASVSGGRVVSVTVTNGGTGYTRTPTVSFSGGGGNGAQATATTTGVVSALFITSSGSGYNAAPLVTISGGGGSGATAVASILPGMVTSLSLTSGGSGYTSAPTISFSGGGSPTTPAVAVADSPSKPLVPKAIQELFTLDYGRMNATLGVEVPFTNFFIQTTIPYGYVDPPTEIFQSGETQLWKITHNGVDTHLIHFHLFDVQVINRVGWDGMIKPPDANEVGWKDTVRMNPLEDIIVALHPMKQVLPFELPNSVRTMDVTEPIGASNANNTPGFANIDPTNQPAPVNNALVNFGWEYVWHCHILSHEEIDMMRPMSMAVMPDAPTNLTVARVGSGNNQSVILTWTDQSINETGFTVQRATSLNGPWLSLVPAPAAPGSGMTVDYTDNTVARRTTYYYRVMATNVVGYDQTYAAPAVGYPTVTANSDPVYAASPVTTLAPVAGEGPVFADSFENMLAMWSGSAGQVQTTAQSVIGPNGGVLGMATAIGGADPQAAYVFDTSPNHEVMYDASFYFDGNRATTGDSPVEIFTGLDQNGEPAFGVEYQSEVTRTYQLRGWVSIGGEKDYSNWKKFTLEAGEDELPSTTHKVEVAWQSGSRGGLSLYIDDGLFATLNGDTSTSKLEEVLLGPAMGQSANASGTLSFDEFTSSRLSGISYNIYLPSVDR